MSQYSPEDYSNYRINKAKETLSEVNILIENQLWNTAISRMYYACFYAVGALLIKDGITTGTHTGTRQKFGQFYVKTNIVNREIAKVYTKLFEKRNK